MIGRSRDVRGPDAIELAFVGLVVTMASVIAVWFGVQLMRMTESLDATSIAGGPQTEAVLYRATNGRWPSPSDPQIVSADQHGTYVRHLILGAGGVITTELTLGPISWTWDHSEVPVHSGSHGFLSFRPELFGSPDAPSISYLCGYARPTAGVVDAAAVNRTTLARKDLPPYCR